MRPNELPTDNSIRIPKEESVWKGISFWTEEIKKAGVYDELRHFNDVITEKKAPHPESSYKEPVLRDVRLDGKTCDIYHTDHERGDTYHRIYIHIKE